MLARVTLQDPDGGAFELAPGDIIGRLDSAAMPLADARVSEAHAMISLREGRLQMIALRGGLALAGEAERVGTAPAIGKLARVAGGLLLLHDDRLSHLDESGQVRSSIGVGTEGIELATDEAAGLYAIGYRSAPIAIRRMGDMEPFALLEGHRGRVGAVRFSVDGHWLVSAGWDGTVRTWSLDALLADPAELRAALEADLGEPIEARLERTARLEAAQPSPSGD